MIEYSRHNIFSKIADSDNYFIINLLHGNADILSNAEARKLERIRTGSEMIGNDRFCNELIKKGYLSNPEAESKKYRLKYLDFIDSREADEIQLIFATNYSCNFSCSYCYQDQYSHPAGQLSKDVIDAFLAYIQNVFAARKKYVTLFGGEPLLAGTNHKILINYLVEKLTENKIDLCIVTNGFYLDDYIEIIKKGKIREVQVTIDGTPPVHNSRRHLSNGGSTFESIVRGIDACLNNNIPVNLRMVADKENIDNLPELARYAIEKGWTSNPLFKTQIGRNYELHHCQSTPDKLFDRISLFEKIYRLSKNYPEILQFNKPSYSVTRFLSENGTLPDPLFDSCPACKTEFAFDYSGRIYPCTATVGRVDESIGTFFPETSGFNKKKEEWENRDIVSIPRCMDCNLQLACGGGCGSVGKIKTGSVFSPDCRPVRELLSLGFSAYFNV